MSRVGRAALEMMRASMWKSWVAALVLVLALVLAACASAHDGPVDEIDAPDTTGDGPEADAGDELDAPDEVDAPVSPIDAPPGDGPVIDAPPIDAPPPPIDAPAMPIDAPIDAMCSPTWHDVLGNGGFETGVAPWVQTSTIIRDQGGMPFAPHNGTYAALFGASNNANDVLVQNLTIPAGATALRVRGYQCFVTEDIFADDDTFTATLETPAGTVLDTLFDVNNSSVAPFCAWGSFTWNAPTAHAGQTIVLRLRGRTNIAFLTRYAVDTMAAEWFGCP
jgi:hypothetical protein